MGKVGEKQRIFKPKKSRNTALIANQNKNMRAVVTIRT